MTKKSNLLLLSLLFTIGLFVYLTVHHYALKTGAGGGALCSISDTLNCDAAATSSFAELGGIPIALLGGVFHLILFMFVAPPRIGLIENSAQLRFTVRALLVFSLSVSAIMAIISAVLIKVLCPFCAGTYVFSVINLWLGWNAIPAGREKANPALYLGDYKSHFIALLCVPFFSWAINGMVLDNYGLSDLQKYIPEKLAAWKSAPVNTFDTNVGLTNKVENPRVTIVEFADFKCPHCKNAANSIDTFLKGKPDILFVFKPYPLDGSCNEGIPAGDGSRCQLAAYTLCAEQIAGRGWDTHDWIFARQEELFSVSDASKLLPDLQRDLGLDPAKMSACADSTETRELIKKGVEEGRGAKVDGTPTVYVNGKKLPWGQMLEVLKAAHREL